MTDALPARWRKAALLGSLWASSEIVVGSFLHAVKFPLAGTVLACIGVCILVAGERLWHDRGLLWRAGVVCAMMKSLSPSAVILGPMVGILLEALALELAVRTFGRAPAGLIMGGALAAMMPVAQKISSLLITYGADAARLYVAMYESAARTLGMTAVGAVDLIAAWGIVNLVLGMIAAALGIRVARIASGIKDVPALDRSVRSDFDFRPSGASVPFRSYLIPLHVLALVGGLFAIHALSLPVAAGLVVIYVILSFRLYASVAHRFRNPTLWLELATVAVLAGLFLGSRTGGGWSWTGLTAGFQMALRGGVIVAAFSAISVELRNPVIVATFLGKREKTVAAALTAAFQALPGMMNVLGDQQGFIRHPFRALARALAAAVRWAEESGIPGRRRLFIVTGEQGSGKTTLLAALAEGCSRRGLSMGGFLSVARFDAGGRIGYDLRMLPGGEELALCRKGIEPTGLSSGPYQFSPVALEAGRTALMTAIGRAQVLLIDEIGPLEIKGGGWAPVLPRVLREHGGSIVLSVRPPLIGEVERLWGCDPEAVWTASSTDAATAATALVEASRA